MEFAHELKEKNMDIVQELGKGAYGSVYLAVNTYYGVKFAIKYGKNESITNESNLLRIINSPYVIKIYEQFVIKESTFLVLQYCPNGSLKEYVKQSSNLPSNLCFIYLKLIAQGLLACHNANIVHRDIKPSNILLDDHMYPHISDFGISRLVKPGEKLDTTGGSIAYMAPELFSPGNKDPFKADMWSLGITLYYMALGKTPWTNTNKTLIIHEIQEGALEIPSYINKDITKLIRMLCTKNPASRPNASDLIELLNPIPSYMPSHTQPIPTQSDNQSGALIATARTKLSHSLSRRFNRSERNWRRGSVPVTNSSTSLMKPNAEGEVRAFASFLG